MFWTSSKLSTEWCHAAKLRSLSIALDNSQYDLWTALCTFNPQTNPTCKRDVKPSNRHNPDHPHKKDLHPTVEELGHNKFIDMWHEVVLQKTKHHPWTIEKDYLAKNTMTLSWRISGRRTNLVVPKQSSPNEQSTYLPVQGITEIGLIMLCLSVVICGTNYRG